MASVTLRPMPQFLSASFTNHGTSEAWSSHQGGTKRCQATRTDLQIWWRGASKKLALQHSQCPVLLDPPHSSRLSTRHSRECTFTCPETLTPSSNKKTNTCAAARLRHLPRRQLQDLRCGDEQTARLEPERGLGLLLQPGPAFEVPLTAAEKALTFLSCHASCGAHIAMRLK